MRIIKNAAGLVLYFGPTIELNAVRAVSQSGSTDTATTTANASLVDANDPPPGFVAVGGQTTYIAGTWAHTAAGQATAAEVAQASFADGVRMFDGIVQGRIDEVARSFGYGDPNRPEVSPILHAVSYADEPAVPRFQAEGQALRAWRSNTWAYCGQVLNAVAQGQRPTPTGPELLAELEDEVPAPVQVPL